MMEKPRPQPIEANETFDSGARRQATVAGQGLKPVRFDLLPTVGIRRLAETMAEGAEKYGEDNWQKGIPISNCLNHALGHLFAYRAGDRSEDHVGHALANLCFIAHFEEAENLRETFANLRGGGPR